MNTLPSAPGFGFRPIAVALCVSLLGGCAINPIVSWDPPPKKESADSPMVQDDARAYSDAARKAYQRAINSQVKASGQLSSGLIVAGALAAALAAGRVHRDALIGASLIGGTAYALGSWNLDKRRLTIYQAGVDAFNCSNRAVAPLNMRQADFDSLGQHLTGLETALSEANAAIADADARVGAFSSRSAPNFEAAQPLQLSIAAARNVVAQGNQAVGPGRQLHVGAGSSGPRLKDAVDKIDAAIGKALIDILPDLASTSKVIASLSGFAGSIAPGAGIEASLNESLAKFNTVKTEAAITQVTPPKEVTDAVARMDAAVARVATSTQVVQGHVAAHGAAMQADTLADCGLGDVSFPLATAPSALSLDPGGGARFVAINGGTPPFEVRQAGAALVVAGPVKLERHFQVAASASAPAGKTFSLLITDSSSPVKTSPLSVQIAGAPAPLGDNRSAANSPVVNQVRTPANAAPSAATAQRTSVQIALDRTAPFKTPDQTTISMGGATSVAADGAITVTLSCKAKPAACLPRATLRQAFMASVGAAVDAQTLGRISIVTRPKDCQCAL